MCAQVSATHTLSSHACMAHACTIICLLNRLRPCTPPCMPLPHPFLHALPYPPMHPPPMPSSCPFSYPSISPPTHSLPMLNIHPTIPHAPYTPPSCTHPCSRDIYPFHAFHSSPHLSLHVPTPPSPHAPSSLHPTPLPSSHGPHHSPQAPIQHFK